MRALPFALLLAGCSLINPYDFVGPDGAVDAGPPEGDAGPGGDGGLDAAVDAGAPCDCEDGSLCLEGMCRDVTDLAVGDRHMCALAGGRVFCWGDNARCELGDCDATTDIAVEVPLDQAAVDVDLGEQFGCAVLETGSVRCWGSRDGNRLGGPQTEDRLVAVNNLPAMVEVDLGTTHACARAADGELYCWGDNSRSQAADGVGIVQATRVAGDVTAFAAGDQFTCAADTSRVYCWGSATNGRLGEALMLFSVAPSSPQVVPGINGTILQLTAGERHACALVADSPANEVWCWGDNTRAQVSIGGGFGVSPPTVVNLPGNPVAIAAGAETTCATTANGAVRCWGDNRFGQLGPDGPSDTGAPTVVTDLNASEIAMGGATGCVHTRDGLRCWGDDRFGQQGRRSLIHGPQRAGAGVDLTASEIAMGDQFLCAATDAPAGQALCFGRGGRGQLGDMIGQSSSSPRPVFGLLPYRSIRAGQAHVCTVTDGDGVQCWGNGGGFRQGNNSSNDVLAPGMQLQPSMIEVEAVAPGGSHTIVLSNRQPGQTRFAGGANDFDQLGIDSATQRVFVEAPIDFPSTGVVDISAGTHFTCALAQSRIYCWGSGERGQIGATGMSAMSVAVILNEANQMWVDYATACAQVGTAGELQCWGDDPYGAFEPAMGWTDSPRAVATPRTSAPTAVAIGPGQVCVVQDSIAYCRGDNRRGQLGVAGADGNAFVEITNFTDVSDIQAGDGVTCALRSSGEVWCWGRDAHGALGVGRALQDPTPGPVAL